MTKYEPRPNWHPEPWSVPQELAGHASIEPTGAIVAGSWQTFDLIYTAGRFGIDDSGSLKVCFRFATDQTRLQLDDPKAPGFVSVSASNNAKLDVRFDYKQNVRPWDRTLHIKVVNGFLKEADTIHVKIGDRSHGSPGLRVQTFSESNFVFRVLVDPVACYQFVPVADQPSIEIVGGARTSWASVLPSVSRSNHPFFLRIRSEDHWGNPSGSGTAELFLSANIAVRNLPTSVRLSESEVTKEIKDLEVSEPGILKIEVRDATGALLSRTNPLVVGDEPSGRKLFWADFHAQSGETIGTNSSVEYFDFARDVAFLDIVGHQGNDFQITREFWSSLNGLYDEYNVDGRFVTIPGYEWSGNTSLGGDRNVFFGQTGCTIRRSSHALVPDRSDVDTDCHTAGELFSALRESGDDVITFAHVGGRYADIAVAHDAAIETAVEVHSSWGTFEWIVNDAFDLGYRVGIVANSDGHKGRPGAESPGASMFGAYGGLTALPLKELTRASVFEALRARRHYATTGSRAVLDVSIALEEDCLMFDKDPSMGPTGYRTERTAEMGDIVHVPGGRRATLAMSIATSSPVERVEFRRGRELVRVHRPYASDDLGRRIRVTWSGAEYRGRFRMTPWDGRAVLEGNAFDVCKPINFLNKDRELRLETDEVLSWESITTGNFSGFDAMLTDASAGVLKIETKLGKIECDVASIGIEPQVFEFGGLDRKLTIQRLPDVNVHEYVAASCSIDLLSDRDNPLYVNVVTEDGHQVWSSPVYVVPRPVWL